MTGRNTLVGCLTVVAFSISGCGTDESETCLDDLNLNISSATTPHISWTPTDCRVSRVAVSIGNGIVWQLDSRNGLSTILPGFDYGVEPPTAIEVSPATPLQTGNYQVQLYGVREVEPPNQGYEWYPVASAFFAH